MKKIAKPVPGVSAKTKAGRDKMRAAGKPIGAPKTSKKK